MRQFKVGRVSSFDEVMKELDEKNKKARAEFEANGGICLRCNKNPGVGFEDSSALNPFQCKACNGEAEKILSKLRGARGARSFREYRLKVAG